MQIAIVENGNVKAVGDYRTLFPDTSFSSSGPSPEWMAENNCLGVTVFLPHDRDNEKLVACAPYVQDGQVFTVAVEPLTQEELDAKAQSEQLRINAQSKQYLLETDWYVVRYAETGIAIPSDILTKRQEARDAIVEPASKPTFDYSTVVTSALT